MLAIIIFTVVLIIRQRINEPKAQKREREMIKKQTLNSISLTHIDGLRGYGSGVNVRLSKNPKEVIIDENYRISLGELESITINSSKQLTEQQKSVLGRSLIGAVVAGPFGAIIGGMSGVGTEQTTETVWLMTINYKEFGDKKTAIFSVKDDPKVVSKRM